MTTLARLIGLHQHAADQIIGIGSGGGGSSTTYKIRSYISFGSIPLGGQTYTP